MRPRPVASRQPGGVLPRYRRRRRTALPWVLGLLACRRREWSEPKGSCRPVGTVIPFAELERLGATVARGGFGADMAVTSVNDGPVTLILETPPRAL